MMPSWQWHRLSEMPGPLAEQMFRVRQDVFILEQRCLYADIDGLDAVAHHLIGLASGMVIAGYCRVFAPGVVYPESAIGRVLVAGRYRGRGIARALMAEAHRFCERQFGGPAVRLSAQEYLQGFYRSLGYHPVTEPKDEDGIPHVEMLKPR